jgi:hypothetical protein
MSARTHALRTGALRMSAFITGALLSLTPAIALACPACAAGRATTGSPLGFVALGALIALPFAVSGVIVGLLRAEHRATEGHGALDEFSDGTSNPDTRAPRRVE